MQPRNANFLSPERVQPLQTSVSKIHAPFKLFMSAHTVKVFWLTGWYLVAFPNCRSLKNQKKKKEEEESDKVFGHQI